MSCRVPLTAEEIFYKKPKRWETLHLAAAEKLKTHIVYSVLHYNAITFQ